MATNLKEFSQFWKCENCGAVVITYQDTEDEEGEIPSSKIGVSDYNTISLLDKEEEGPEEEGPEGFSCDEYKAEQILKS